MANDKRQPACLTTTAFDRLNYRWRPVIAGSLYLVDLIDGGMTLQGALTAAASAIVLVVSVAGGILLGEARRTRRGRRSDSWVASTSASSVVQRTSPVMGLPSFSEPRIPLPAPLR